MRGYAVMFHPVFKDEFRALPPEVKEAAGEVLDALRDHGPFLGRPEVDTLKGSRHRNMKEMRCDAGGGVWRIAFAFDPQRNAVVLCGGDKAGGGSQRFYRNLIAKADDRFDEWLKGA